MAKSREQKMGVSFCLIPMWSKDTKSNAGQGSAEQRVWFGVKGILLFVLQTNLIGVEDELRLIA